ncbi:MAG: hypothetical protein QW486_09430 [Candidatus Bathyarchaeia archaeon]|nr:hypothetical protein [Candidatus Bathyarchaeota archaeon]
MGFLARRKMLAADEDLANRVVELAKRKGVTVFQTVNEILEQALRVEEAGLRLRDIVEERGIIERARRLGFTFTIERLIYGVSELAYERARGQASQMWLEMGRWYGKYLNSMGKESLRAFREAMELLAFGPPEFEVKEGKGGQISVSLIGERFTVGYLNLLSLFIEGIFENFGYKIHNREVSRGLLRLVFERAG